MTSIGTGYDLSPSTFSPDGRVFQVEYAGKAVDNSGTAIGIKVSDGVVLGVEKMITSKMMVPGSNRRIFNVDSHVGMVVAGLVADGRTLVNKAREECQQYSGFYGSKIPSHVLRDRVASNAHMYSLYWWARPYGCSALMASFDSNGPALDMIEPSGVANRYYGAAIGKHRQAAKTEIEKLKLDELTCREAVKEVAKIIHKLHDEVKDKEFELGLSWICEASNRRHQTVPEEVLAEANQWAQDQLEEDDESDEEDEETA